MILVSELVQMNNNNNDNDNDNNSTVTGNKDEDMDETGQTFVVSFFHKLFTVLYCTLPLLLLSFPPLPFPL